MAGMYMVNGHANATEILSTNISDVTTEYLMTPDDEFASLDIFERRYKVIHGYVALVLCVLGITLNVTNIYILMQKSMRSSSTNVLLTSLAVYDLLTEITYLPFAIYFYILTDSDQAYGHAKGWVYYALVSLNMMNVCHTASLWITVTIATFRYIYVCKHTRANKLCSMQRTYLSIVLVSLESVLMSLPSFVCYSVVEKPLNDSSNQTSIWISSTELCKRNAGFFKILTHLIFGGIIKCSACLILVFFTIRLLFSLKKAKQRRETLMQREMKEGKKKEHRRTTIMLIAVLLVFVITEFPQGILVLVTSFKEEWFRSIYTRLGDLLDIIVLFNTSVNFILYTTMSQRFRETFQQKLLNPVLRKLPCCALNKTGYSQVRRKPTGPTGAQSTVTKTTTENNNQLLSITRDGRSMYSQTEVTEL